MASRHDPQRVSAADFIRGFAGWRLRTARAPVVVTHHGKDAHVLISLADYRRLDGGPGEGDLLAARSEEHTSELQSLMRISYAVFCLKKKNKPHLHDTITKL